jgi:hypothetical protein
VRGCSLTEKMADILDKTDNQGQIVDLWAWFPAFDQILVHNSEFSPALISIGTFIGKIDRSPSH